MGRYLVAAVLGAIVAVLAGAWINNVFTWEVKNRVEALDRIYIDVLESDVTQHELNFQIQRAAV